MWFKLQVDIVSKMKTVILFCALALVVQANLKKGERSAMQKAYDFSAEQFTVEYIRYIETGVKSPRLQALLKLFKAPREIRTRHIETLSDQKQSVTCALCKSAVDVLLKYRREGKDDNYMRDLALGLCVQMNIQPQLVCEGIVDKMLKVLLFIVDERSNLTANSVCGILFQGTECSAEGPEFEWSIEIPTEEITGPKSQPTEFSVDDLTIVHISDIHFDPHYKVGSFANCPEPLCCRRTDVNLTDPYEGAGHWGDYRNCDAPLNVIEATLDQIMHEHSKIDYVYYTGDYIDHAIWLTSIEGNKEVITTIDSLLKEKFKDIPVFPLIGNHEPDPLNLFAPDYIKEKGLESGWMYDFLADNWSGWLPASAQETIRKGGYYTVSPRPGFRIIGINNNDCYTYNFWLMFDPSYLKHQLQWLQDTLQEAEAAGEYVHILAHIPSGSGSCHVTWSREFRRIVDRYHKTISAIFNGHTHTDHFQIYYSRTEPSHPINVAWNGGSVTPFSDVNPNYQILAVDTETYQVTHHETWIMNLTLANLYPEKTPVWYKEYTFENAYGAKDLSPAGLDSLVHKFATNKNLLRMYWAFKVKLGDPSIRGGCNTNCLKNHLCDMVKTQSNDLEMCDKFIEIFSELYD